MDPAHLGAELALEGRQDGAHVIGVAPVDGPQLPLQRACAGDDVAGGAPGHGSDAHSGRGRVERAVGWCAVGQLGT